MLVILLMYFIALPIVMGDMLVGKSCMQGRMKERVGKQVNMHKEFPVHSTLLMYIVFQTIQPFTVANSAECTISSGFPKLLFLIKFHLTLTVPF